MLSIVTVILKSYQELERTLASLEHQNIEYFEHVVVASGFSFNEKLRLEDRWSSKNRRFLFDQDNSLYNAMNMGLRAAQGDWILFLNGGDILWSPDAISMVMERKRASCLAFCTAQRYGRDLYIRPPCRMTKGSVVGCGHQGFVAPLDSDKSKRIYYNESNPISADQEWIRENINHYGIDLHDKILSEFRLGGVSNRPSIRAFKLQLEAGNLLSAVKLLPKMFLYSLLRPRRYYNLMARFHRYKIVNQ